MNRVVCRCADVCLKDIKEFRDIYPNMPIDQVKRALNIGCACMSCEQDDSPIIDIKFNDAIKIYKKS